MADSQQGPSKTQPAKIKAPRVPESIPQAGSLSTTSLPQILLALYRVRYDGTLGLCRGKTTKHIVFQEGAPVHSESNLQVEALGAQLLDQGTISQEDLARSSAYMERKGCREGVAFLALELLDPKGLFLALKQQVRRRLLEAFAWSEGDYTLEPGDEATQEVQPFRSDPYLLVREGLVAHWSTERLLADLTPFIQQFPIPGNGFPEAVRRLKTDEVAELLAAINGKSNLGATIGTIFNSPSVLASIWILITANLISLSDTPLDAESSLHEHDYGQEVEIDILGSSATPATAKAATTSDGSADPSARKKVDESVGADSSASQAMREEVLARIENLAEQDFYQLLAVPDDADGSAIRRAYFAAAKRYHPDALTRLGLSDVKEQAAVVFARISEANETLKNPTKRADYDAALTSDEPEFDANVVAQAETFFRKGEILVRMGDFRGSIEYFQPAVDLWPEECAYQSALGWALYKQPKAEKEQALAHLEKATELDPEDPVAFFRLSVVLRALGEGDRAAECMARAKILDPKIS